MIDNQFDNFLNGKLKDHSAPVPAGLWDKVKDTQLDQFMGDTFKDHIAPVPTDLWEKVTDSQFDRFIGNQLNSHQAPVPADLWDKIRDKQLDDFFADKLIDHTASIPAGLWEKVKPEEKDDRKGFFFFRFPAAALILLALLLGGTLGGYLYVKRSDNTALHTTKPPNNKGLHNSIENAKIPGTIDNHQTNGEQTDGNIEKATTLLPNNNNKTINKIESKTFSTSIQKQNTIIEESGISNGANANTANLNQSKIKSNQTTQTSKLNHSTGLFITKPNNNKEANGIPIYTDPIINNNHLLGTDENEVDYATPYHSTLLTANTIPTEGNRFTGLQSLLDKQLANNNHTSKFRNVVICPADYKNRNTDLYLEPYLSPDFAFKTVTNNSATQQYLLKKDSSESMQIGYSAGIRLVKPISNNVLLKAGLQYSQINEKYVYRTENEVKTTTVVSVRTIIRAPGDTVIVRDTSILLQIGYHNNTVYNHFRSFDVPFTVGYQFGNENFKIGINAGVIFNVSTWQEGVILDSSMATVPLVKGGTANAYKSNIGLGIYGGISIVKKLSDDLHIFAEPYFRYNLSNMTNTQSPYQQKINIGGLSLGLRFNLNRK